MSVAYNSLVYPNPQEYPKPHSPPNPIHASTPQLPNYKEPNATQKLLYDTKKPNPIHIPSLLCIMSIGFIANCEYGVVMPSIFGYLQSINGTEAELGIAISAASFAQLCCLPIFGLWSDRRTMREAIIVSMFLGISGNVLYALAGAIGSPYCIIAGRTLCGMYMGVISITNSFVAMVTTPETRTKFMAQINGINAIGMVSGPGFSFFLTLIKFNIGPVIFDDKTNPGWFIATLVFISSLCFLFVFKEPKAAIPQKREMESTTNIQQEPVVPHMTGKQYMWFVLTAFLKPYGACFIICFVQNFDFSVLETIVTPFTSQLYHWGSVKNSFFYSALSLEMVVVIFITAAASRFKLQDRFILLAAQTCVGIGSIGMLLFFTRKQVPLHIFSIFSALLIAGIPSQNIAVMSTYSKLLTAEFGQAKQGLYTGIIMLFGSLARILGPLWGGFTMAHQHLILLFSLIVGLWAFDIMFTLSFFKKLKPPVENESERVSLLSH